MTSDNGRFSGFMQPETIGSCAFVPRRAWDQGKVSEHSVHSARVIGLPEAANEGGLTIRENDRTLDMDLAVEIKSQTQISTMER
jgi:hypothetical protein